MGRGLDQARWRASSWRPGGKGRGGLCLLESGVVLCASLGVAYSPVLLLGVLACIAHNLLQGCSPRRAVRTLEQLRHAFAIVLLAWRRQSSEFGNPFDCSFSVGPEAINGVSHSADDAVVQRVGSILESSGSASVVGVVDDEGAADAIVV